jgi:type II secretory pathway component PulF
MKWKRLFLIFFLKSLGALLASGIPLLPALDGLAKQQETIWGRKVLEKLAKCISNGFSLSKAMEKQPEVFSKFIIGLVQVGEKTGTLPSSLEKIAVYLDRSHKVQLRLSSALMYPLFLLVLIFFGTILLIKIFVPAFLPVFRGLQESLPFSTRFLLFLSHLFSSWFFWIGMILLSFFLYLAIRKSKTSIFLRLPLIGHILKNGFWAQLASILAVAYSSGLSLAKGLELGVSVVEDKVFQAFIQDSRLALVRGEKLSDYFLENQDMISPLLGHMMAVAETTGEVEKLLLKCARILEEEMEFTIERFSNLLEPAALMILGCIVGFVLFGVFSPIYQMLQVAG